MFIISATVPCTKKKSKVGFFSPLGWHICKLQWGQQWSWSCFNGVCTQHLQSAECTWHAAFPPTTLGPSIVSQATAKNEQETSQNLKKGNPICYLEKVKTYSPKQIRKDLSTQRTTSEDFHADTHKEDFVISWHLQKDQHYSLLLMCSMQHGSHRYTRYWESDSERSLKTYFLHWHSSHEHHLWNRLQPCTKTRLSSAELEAHRPCSELRVH